MRVLKFPLIFLLAWLLSGCASLLPPEPTSTPTETTAPTATPTRKPTPLPPTATMTPSPTATIMPTIVPLIGQVNAPTNVRSRPSKGGDIYGGVYYPGTVHVIGRNDNATWLWITFSDSPTGTGWVTLKAIALLPDDLGKLPIVVFPTDGSATQVYPPLIYAVIGVPLPVNMPVAGSRTATVLQLLNVRVGPGVGYSMMGSIQAGTLLTVTGSIADNAWLQIEYPSGPDGRAWVLGSLVKINDDISALPVYNLLGTVAPTSDGSIPPATSDATDEGGGGLFDSTPLPTVTSQAPQAEVTNQINVRSGPASSFKSIGIVNPGLKVNLTGLTLNGLWYQIQYADSPDGVGWVAAGFIKILGDTRHLVYFDNSGTPLPTPKP